MGWDYWIFSIIRAVSVVLMAYTFHFGIKEKSIFKSIIFWLFALMMLDIIVSLEDIRP